MIPLDPSTSTPAAGAPADDRRLRPPQFTLRGLMIWMTVVAGCCALFAAVGTLWSMAILLVLMLVAAHVLGNSLGTRLRDGADRERGAASGGQIRVTAPRSTMPRELRSSDPSRLAKRARLHWINLVMALGGALAGGYFGGRVLVEGYPDATTAAVLLAYGSSGVLGGFAGFAVSSFLAVMRQALNEAHRAARPQQRPPQPPQ